MDSIVELIEHKRDGQAHSAEEIERLVRSYVDGDMPDYQMAAWLMAAFLRGLDADETVWLTKAMAESGDMVDLSPVPGIKVDKHSTGGVGDKTTLVVAPLVASCGAHIAKMSGRGLGHTGGTLDKLESIPGFSVFLPIERFVAQVRDIGIAVVAQSDDIDPADKKMYALRDVTGTVPSVPLIVSSIISKKIAGGADAILLDVKVGSGAFMKTDDEARVLAAELTRVGQALGRKVVCVLSDMDQPLGHAVGNALEVCEAIRTLKGEGPEDLTQLAVALGAKLLVLGGLVSSEDAGARMLRESIETGKALHTFKRWVAAQGGDPAVADDTSLLPLGNVATVVTAEKSGYIQGFDTEGVGRAAMLLGAGREKADDTVDPGAGLVLSVKTGDRVAAGDPIATLYASCEERFEAAASRLGASVHVGDTRPARAPLFREV